MQARPNPQPPGGENRGNFPGALLTASPGLTHHFSLGFLGFSWKIQDIHMIVRK
jgi:hypothetical protein